jgi:hypothetical protein
MAYGLAMENAPRAFLRASGGILWGMRVRGKGMRFKYS